MASSNVEFYEKQQILQDSQHTCELERMALEQNLNSYSKSDTRIARLRAAKLQAYWKKICEDERKSQLRNEQILKEFDRVEKHVRVLHDQTEKYALMKEQYEEYIERMYPHWKEKVQQWQARQQIGDAGAGQRQDPSFAERFLGQKGQQVQFESTPGQTSVYPRTQTESVVDTKDNPMNKMQHFGVKPLPQKGTPDSTTQNGSQFGSLSQVTDLPMSTPRQTAMQNGDVIDGDQMFRKSGSLERGSSGYRQVVIPTSGRMGGTGSSQGSEVLSTQRTGTMSEQQTGGSEQVMTARSMEESVQESLRSRRSEGDVSQRSEGVVSPGLNQSFEEVSEAQSASLRSTGSSGRRYFDRQGKVDHEDIAIESDMSLSLSIGVEVEGPTLGESGKSDVPTPRIMIPETPREETPALARLGLSAEGSLPSAESSLKAELSLSAFYCLLKFVQEEFPDTFSPETFYRSHPPSQAARKDIIFNAKHRDNLDHHDPGVISMVILDELPLLVQSLPGECLLSDDLVKSTSAFTKEQDIRTRLSGDAAVMWDNLMDHLTLAVRYNVMDAKEIAEKFVPFLLSRTALVTTVDRASDLLAQFLQAATTKRSGSTASDVTSPPTSPVKEISHSFSPIHKASSPPPKMGSIPEDDDFFSVKPPQEDLTQTAAYRNLLSGTLTKTTSINDEDSEDDIEKQLALSPQHSLEKQGSLTGHGGALSAGVNRVPSKDDEDSLVSSLSGAAPAYVPSAMDKSANGRSSGSYGLGGSGSKKMSAAFRTGSDIETDTEIDLPSTGAGGHRSQVSEDKDDFDFYD